MYRLTDYLFNDDDIYSETPTSLLREEPLTFEDEVRAVMKDISVSLPINSYEDRILSIGILN